MTAPRLAVVAHVVDTPDTRDTHMDDTTAGADAEALCAALGARHAPATPCAAEMRYRNKVSARALVRDGFVCTKKALGRDTPSALPETLDDLDAIDYDAHVEEFVMVDAESEAFGLCVAASLYMLASVKDATGTSVRVWRRVAAEDAALGGDGLDLRTLGLEAQQKIYLKRLGRSTVHAVADTNVHVVDDARQSFAVSTLLLRSYIANKTKVKNKRAGAAVKKIGADASDVLEDTEGGAAPGSTAYASIKRAATEDPARDDAPAATKRAQSTPACADKAAEKTKRARVAKPAVKPAVKPEAKPAVKPEAKPTEDDAGPFPAPVVRAPAPLPGHWGIDELVSGSNLPQFLEHPRLKSIMNVLDNHEKRERGIPGAPDTPKMSIGNFCKLSINTMMKPADGDKYRPWTALVARHATLDSAVAALGSTQPSADVDRAVYAESLVSALQCVALATRVRCELDARARCEAERKTARASVDAAAKRADAARKKCSGAQAREDKLARTVAELEARVAAREAEVGALTTEVGALTAEVGALTAGVGAPKAAKAPEAPEAAQVDEDAYESASDDDDYFGDVDGL